MIEALRGRVEMVSLLLSAGADTSEGEDVHGLSRRATCFAATGSHLSLLQNFALMDRDRTGHFSIQKQLSDIQ